MNIGNHGHAFGRCPRNNSNLLSSTVGRQSQSYIKQTILYFTYTSFNLILLLLLLLLLFVFGLSLHILIKARAKEVRKFISQE
jgi:hypothetical protein